MSVWANDVAKADLAAISAALAATGTTAAMGVEVFSPALDAMDTGPAMARCAAALDHCLALAGPKPDQ